MQCNENHEQGWGDEQIGFRERDADLDRCPRRATLRRSIWGETREQSRSLEEEFIDRESGICQTLRQEHVQMWRELRDTKWLAVTGWIMFPKAVWVLILGTRECYLLWQKQHGECDSVKGMGGVILDYLCGSSVITRVLWHRGEIKVWTDIRGGSSARRGDKSKKAGCFQKLEK
jgi:hypothetical protein